MKNLNIYFIAIFFLITACDDDFFETYPATQITTEEVFSSEENIDAFINGALRYLFENSTSQDNPGLPTILDRKSTRLNSSHVAISYAVFCLKKKTNRTI